MDINKKFLDDWSDVLSKVDEAKADPRLEEALAIYKRMTPEKSKVLEKAEDIKNEKKREVELNRLVPGFTRYLVIGQASKTAILANQQLITLATVYLPSYRGEFFLVDSDSVSRRTYTMKDFNERQQVSFGPPLGGTDFVQPWFIGTPYGDPILSLEQANIVIQHRRSK